MFCVFLLCWFLWPLLIIFCVSLNGPSCTPGYTLTPLGNRRTKEWEVPQPLHSKVPTALGAQGLPECPLGWHSPSRRPAWEWAWAAPVQAFSAASPLLQSSETGITALTLFPPPVPQQCLGKPTRRHGSLYYHSSFIHSFTQEMVIEPHSQGL